MESSSSSSYVQQKPEVFLSFSEDTRNNFTSHLYMTLKQSKIYTFVDYQLERKENISPEVLTAIEDSKISIIILSKNYASSLWCLEKLCKILECKETQKVVPIFYHVDPSDVQNQKGSFEEAFAKHQERFKDRTDKVERWRAALVEVANLPGYHLEKDMFEVELIEDIVKFIWANLNELSSDVKGLVGMASRIKELEELLDHMECDGVRILGIWGMPGVGKTTTAEALLKRISSQFDASYFLADVTKRLECARRELFSEILKENLKIGTPSTKGTFITHKVLIVLDDVYHSQQVEHLIEDRSCFGPGSTIIITSRDKEVLQGITNQIHMVEKLNNFQALELLNRYTFRGNSFVPRTMCMRLVKYADGIPLALKILGSLLCGESERTWESALGRLEKVPNKEIHEVLRTSYDELEEGEKRIFLDVACFFNGEDKNHVVDILYGCDTRLNVLQSKSLITILNNNIQMNNLIQKMGQEIVREESKHPGERSRLWRYKDIIDVLTTNKGTEAVEGIFLNMSEIEEQIRINPEAFKRMYNLRLLKIYNRHSQVNNKVHLSLDSQIHSNKLAYLHWLCYPLQSLPLNFNPENLVELQMHYSQVTQLWKGTLILEKLKWIDLSHSYRLMEMPDLSTASNLVSLKLQNCKMIKFLTSSISKLKSLEILDLSGCTRLTSVPELPPNLQYLDAHNCISLEANSSSFPIGHGRGQRFIFTNCKMLDQNTMWSKTQLGIQQKATADVKLYHMKQDLRPRFSSICICFPGSEIPEWFSRQNQGSSLTTQLPPHFHDHKLVGLAVCAIVAFKDYNKDLGFAVKCQYNFKATGDDCHDYLSSLSVWDKSDSPRFIGSDHVFVGDDFNLYSDWYSGESKNHLSKTSFKFTACDSDSGNQLDSCIIKKCGVCLLYAQHDSSEIKIISKSDIKIYNESGSEADEWIQPSCLDNRHSGDGFTTNRLPLSYLSFKAKPRIEIEHRGNVSSYALLQRLNNELLGPDFRSIEAVPPLSQLSFKAEPSGGNFSFEAEPSGRDLSLDIQPSGNLTELSGGNNSLEIQPSGNSSFDEEEEARTKRLR